MAVFPVILHPSHPGDMPGVLLPELGAPTRWTVHRPSVGSFAAQHRTSAWHPADTATTKIPSTWHNVATIFESKIFEMNIPLPQTIMYIYITHFSSVSCRSKHRFVLGHNTKELQPLTLMTLYRHAPVAPGIQHKVVSSRRRNGIRRGNHRKLKPSISVHYT